VNLADYDALSFDCYGTLIDWETGLSAILKPWARGAGASVDREELLARFARHEARAEEEHPQVLYPQILVMALRGVGEELGIAVTREDERALASSVPDWPAFADSHEALVSLGRDHRLIILSNVDRTSFAGSNARLGVTFDAVLTAQDIGSYKPSPRNFEALLSTVAGLGVAPGRLLHVAQSLFHDHVPAKQAGLPTVWINRRHGRPGWGATPVVDVGVSPDREFASMADFATAMAAAR